MSYPNVDRLVTRLHRTGSSAGDMAIKSATNWSGSVSGQRGGRWIAVEGPAQQVARRRLVMAARPPSSRNCGATKK
jgi:hypothetical protein